MASIRVARPDDGAAVAAIYAPYVSDTTISFEEVPPTGEEMAERIRRLLRTHPFLVYEEGGIVLGYAYGSPHAERAAYRWSCDVTVYASPRIHRRGVGRRLYTELLRLLEMQGYHVAYAGITRPNENSLGLHEAMGFRHVGDYREVGFKHGAWRDVAWFARPLNQGLPTGAPQPFAAVAADPASRRSSLHERPGGPGHDRRSGVTHVSTADLRDGS